MEEVRCGSCDALLFRIDSFAIKGRLEIKCRRCRTLNQIRPSEPQDLIASKRATQAKNNEIMENA